MGQGVFPNAMIFCAGVSTNLKTRTKNQYGIKKHRSAERCVHMSIVGPYIDESYYYTLPSVTLAQPLLSVPNLQAEYIISNHNLGNGRPYRMCPNK